MYNPANSLVQERKNQTFNKLLYIDLKFQNLLRVTLITFLVISRTAGEIKKLQLENAFKLAYFLSTQTFGNSKKSKFDKHHAYMIYTNKGMLLDKVLCDVIPCVCPLIDHASRPMKTLEFLTLLYNKVVPLLKPLCFLLYR